MHFAFYLGGLLKESTVPGPVPRRGSPPSAPSPPQSSRAVLSAAGMKQNTGVDVLRGRVGLGPSQFRDQIGTYDVTKDYAHAYGPSWRSEVQAAADYARRLPASKEYPGLAAPGQAAVKDVRPSNRVFQPAEAPVIRSRSFGYGRAESSPLSESVLPNGALFVPSADSPVGPELSESSWANNAYGRFSGWPSYVRETLRHEGRHQVNYPNKGREGYANSSAANARSVAGPAAGHGLSPVEQLGWLAGLQQEHAKHNGRRITDPVRAREFISKAVSMPDKEFDQRFSGWEQEPLRGLRHLRRLNSATPGAEKYHEEQVVPYRDGWIDYLSEQMPGTVQARKWDSDSGVS